MSVRLLKGLLSILAISLLLNLGAFGDDVYARIRGMVTDPSGAALTGATVTATNVTTGLERTTSTQPNGGYEFLNLPIGTYTVKVSAASFKTYQSTQIPLSVNQVYNLPVQMSVGVVSETVEVKADTIQVETTSNQLQTLVSGQQIVDLLGRSTGQYQRAGRLFRHCCRRLRL